jgi:DnaK suppressor protein
VSKSPAKKAPARSKAATAKAAPRKAAAKPKAPAKPVKTAKPTTKRSAKPAAKAAAKAPAKAPKKTSAKTAAKTGTKLAPTKTKHVSTTAKPVAKAPKGAPVPSPVVSKPSAPKPLIAAAAPIGVMSPKPVSPAPQPSATSTLPKTTDKPLASPAAAAASTRFTERFAPPRPPQRVLPEPAEPVRPAFKADPRLANAWKNKAGRDLTEDELLAMPDGEYMNEKQLEFFRTRLQALKDDLLSNAGETTEHLREDTSIVPDPADRATIEEEHALELRTRDRERKLLKKISQSLARIEAGDYGYCDETGEPIGLGRLLARPTATLSLEAQQRRELKQKMFGD